MQPIQINLDTATVEELKLAVYDLNRERANFQARATEAQKQIDLLNQVIYEKELKENIQPQKVEVIEKEDKK